jgi:hypothetical protein
MNSSPPHRCRGEEYMELYLHFLYERSNPACFLGLLFDPEDGSRSFRRSVGWTTRLYGVTAQKIMLFMNTIRRLSEVLRVDRANRRRFVYLHAFSHRMYGVTHRGEVMFVCVGPHDVLNGLGRNMASNVYTKSWRTNSILVLIGEMQLTVRSNSIDCI